MNARTRHSLIANCAYVPAPRISARIQAEIIRDWRTAKTIARQILAAPSREAWFIGAAVIAGAIAGGLLA